MRDANQPFAFEEVKGRLPVCSTLLTESPEEKTRHLAFVLALTETGGRFSSRKRVVPGEPVSVILHPDLRYAIRGRVTWTRQMRDEVNINFGVVFEEKIPESLWEILGETAVA
ncbi:MAG TPA: PilZ domain-containing protein [Terriglobia bacterium]|nr:PilZ domain-containing protein [Terriglobia bacterium]